MQELAKKKLVGVCELGVPTCDADMNIIDCKGAVYPVHPDKCDGLDNNCDGGVDNWFYPTRSHSWRYQDEPNPCGSTFGACKNAKIECIDGAFVCNFPPEYVEGDEMPSDCDGIDNNCDGSVDNIDLTCTDLLGNPIACTCYEGPAGTERYGVCQQGFYECLGGEILCVGQVLPSPELCDNADNDCNNIIDDTGDILAALYDVVFVIDDSGSMCRWHHIVAIALTQYIEQFEGNPNLRFSVVIMSDWEDPDGDGVFARVTKQVDFSTLNDVRTFLLNRGCSGSGAEASVDSMQMVCDQSNPLDLSWREDANRLMFVFTDEGPQTYSTPPTTAQNVIDSCIGSGTLPFVWHGAWGGSEFLNMTTAAGGTAFEMEIGVSPEEEWEPIFNDLNDVVVTLCQP